MKSRDIPTVHACARALEAVWGCLHLVFGKAHSEAIRL